LTTYLGGWWIYCYFWGSVWDTGDTE